MLSHTSVNLVSCAPLADGFIPSDPALFVPSPYRYTHGCEIQQQRSALLVHVTYPLTTNPVTINNHCSLTHSVTLQRSGIRDITIGSGVFRDAMPRLQQCASYFHSVIRFRAARVMESFTFISTAFFEPIFTTSKILNSVICICLTLNFTQIYAFGEYR